MAAMAENLVKNLCLSFLLHQWRVFPYQQYQQSLLCRVPYIRLRIGSQLLGLGTVGQMKQKILYLSTTYIKLCVQFPHIALKLT